MWETRVKYYDQETDQTFVFLTNNFEITAIIIAGLYKQRWQVELFFKWIKQHLKINAFWGFSENAVKTQIWIAVCTYLLIAYIKKQVISELSMYEIQQILSVSIFSKITLNELLTNTSKNFGISDQYNQLTLF
jgi:IS4 transposase